MAPSQQSASEVSDRRRPDFGEIEGIAEKTSPEISLEIFQKICEARYFDLRVKRAQDDKDVEALVYLSVGQEAPAAAIAVATGDRNPLVTGQHRGHSMYLSFGGRPELLVDELLGLPTGCCGGMGGSPPIHDFSRGIVGHNGLIGDQVPVATGLALGAPDRTVICFLGDGAAEEDYVLAALGFAASNRQKILFVCEDNDLSVLTPTSVRRGWAVDEVGRAFGLNTIDIADDPWVVHHWADRMLGDLPALINVRTCRELWHVGTGSDDNADWNRFDLTKDRLASIGLQDEASAIEAKSQKKVEKLWQERLQKRSETLAANTLQKMAD
jgi:acetoin:2,6-dichlorophenolindophenol oxidoreductase subunit alpha